MPRLRVDHSTISPARPNQRASPALREELDVDTASRLTSLYLPMLIQSRRSLGGRIFDFSCQVAVMAIANRTSDSFYIENGSAGRITAGAAQTTRRMRLGHVITPGTC
jgi:hypothetical protein